MLSKKKDEIESEQNIDLAFWVTENPIIIKNNRERKTDPVFPQRLIEVVSVKDIDRHLRMTKTTNITVRKIGVNFLKTRNSLNNLLVDTKIRNERIDVKEVNKFDETIDVLWDKIKVHYKFMVERKHEYLNWRYCDPRAGNYIVKLVAHDEEPVGYSILRINRHNRDYPTGFIVDFVVIPGYQEASKALISSSLEYFQENNVNTVRYWTVKGSANHSIFKKYGFLYLGRKAPEVIMSPKKINKGDWEKFQTAEKSELHFQIGDTEFM